MVNVFLRHVVAARLMLRMIVEPAARSKDLCRGRQGATTPMRAFAQTLVKLYFLNLVENLRRILLDYGQKHPGSTNAAFNAVC